MRFIAAVLLIVADICTAVMAYAVGVSIIVGITPEAHGDLPWLVDKIVMLAQAPVTVADWLSSALTTATMAMILGGAFVLTLILAGAVLSVDGVVRKTLTRVGILFCMGLVSGASAWLLIWVANGDRSSIWYWAIVIGTCIAYVIVSEVMDAIGEALGEI